MRMHVNLGKSEHSEGQPSPGRACNSMQHTQGTNLLGGRGQSLQGRMDVLLHRHLDAVHHRCLQRAPAARCRAIADSRQAPQRQWGSRAAAMCTCAAPPSAASCAWPQSGRTPSGHALPPSEAVPPSALPVGDLWASPATHKELAPRGVLICSLPCILPAPERMKCSRHWLTPTEDCMQEPKRCLKSAPSPH